MPRFSRIVSGWIWIVLAPGIAGAQPDTTGLPRAVVSRIAPDYAIITEVSVSNPYLGQQFSIIYRLHALHPPAAVDIDPQQFSGFWSEIVPISRESATAARPAKGQEGIEYLLRQVIAFPLLEGALLLPPLSVKIKSAERLVEPSGEWDLAGVSLPIPMEVAPLPQRPRSDKDLHLVGHVEGSLRETKEEMSAVLLEIQGTANLALFQPLDWLKPLPGVRYRARLAAADSVSQTIDRQGNRRILLLQRQRWLIGFSGDIRDQRIPDLLLPVFDPQENAWKEVRLAGVKPAESALQPDSSAPAISKDERAASGRFMPILPALFLLLVLAAILVALLWLRPIRGGRLHRKTSGITSRIPIEKELEASPRTFLDSAHKFLMKVAEDKGRSQNLGSRDELLDQCWLNVQYHRFSREPLPAEMRSNILNTIGQLREERAGQNK